MDRFPQKERLILAYKLISPFIHRTPVLTCSSIEAMIPAQLFFKCDNFQKGGSYKIRGATNAVLSLEEEHKRAGVATHSSGNFAQALSIAADTAGIIPYIIMPGNAPPVKIQAVRSYGGRVILSESTLKSREQTLHKTIAKHGSTFVHPSNDMDVIIGQATMAMELIDEVEQLDYIVCPIGGGGIGAGTCLACLHFSPGTKVIGAEPMNADDAYWSVKKGSIQPSVNPDTIADGLRTQLGNINFPIIKELIQEIIRVEEDQIIAAMRLVWERMKIIIEPSSAVSLAAVLFNKDQFENKRIGLIITGGNVSLDHLPFD